MSHARTLGIVILTLTAPAAVAAEAQDGAMCAFVKRVLADQPSEFTAFKGARAKNDQDKTMFDGTTTPDDTMKCTLHVRRKLDKQILAPNYACSRFGLKTEGAKALYVRYTNELTPCLPGATISETLPKAADETTTWRWTAKTADYELKLEASNGAAMLAALFKNEPITDDVKSSMSVSVEILDLRPGSPGATIPVMQ